MFFTKSKFLSGKNLDFVKNTNTKRTIVANRSFYSKLDYIVCGNGLFFFVKQKNTGTIKFSKSKRQPVNIEEDGSGI